jgi:undecaprenyl-diphosphatase
MLEWDRQALLWINSHHNVFLDAILLPVSLAGEFGVDWIAVGLGLLVMGKREHRKAAVILLLTLLVADRCMVPLLSGLFPRDRPYLALEGIRQMGVAWRTNSFPSGHSHSVWIGAIVLGSRWHRLRLPLVGFALLTCYSRPYLGMHYPTDVLAGSLLGISLGFAALGTERWRERRRVNRDA